MRYSQVAPHSSPFALLRPLLAAAKVDMTVNRWNESVAMPVVHDGTTAMRFALIDPCVCRQLSCLHVCTRRVDPLLRLNCIVIQLMLDAMQPTIRDGAHACEGLLPNPRPNAPADVGGEREADRRHRMPAASRLPPLAPCKVRRVYLAASVSLPMDVQHGNITGRFCFA